MPAVQVQTRRAVAENWRSSRSTDLSTPSRDCPTPSHQAIGTNCRASSAVCATAWNREFPVPGRSCAWASTSRPHIWDRYNHDVRKKKPARATKTRSHTTRSFRSLAVTDTFRSFVLDQLADLGDVTA